MGKFDKDRYLKELAIRFCIARGFSPLLEVDVSSSSDLSAAQELLTDIDVLGVGLVVDGHLHRSIFDCKSGKMSAINRAFWASGVVQYSGCDDAFVILKGRAVNNHRISALSIGVDLHDEDSLKSLGETYGIGFHSDLTYLSNIDRWNILYDSYQSVGWAMDLYRLGHSVAPLSTHPWSTFRKIAAELRGVRGNVDPDKPSHVAIYCDILAGTLLLWSSMGRDIRRLYQPSMSKSEFETILKYYIWGGRESYQMRQDLLPRDVSGNSRTLELPGWDHFVKFAGLIIAAPQELFGCIDITRSLAMRLFCGPDIAHDAELNARISDNKRAVQFILGLSDYMISACVLPRDLTSRVQRALSDVKA